MPGAAMKPNYFDDYLSNLNIILSIFFAQKRR